MRMRTVCVASVALLCTGALLARPLPGKSDVSANGGPIQKIVKEAPAREMQPANPAHLAPKAIAPSFSAKSDPAPASRQGGETCASAYVIPGLPFDDSGDTSTAVHDYTASCASNTAPDVVYAYTPAADQIISVSLCGSSYDTVLFMRADSCDGADIGCNDDSCGLQSELTNIALTGGHTYYIIVSGYSASSGAYVISVTEYTPPPPPASCPEGSLFAQTPDGPDASWNAFTSAQTSAFTYTVFEDFGVTGPICDIHWWGLSLHFASGWSACDPTGMQFAVQFYEDAGGVPGNPVCSYTVAPVITDLSLSYAGYALYQFDVLSLSPCCTLQEGWVSIQSLPNGNDCAFLWMSGGAGSCYQMDASGTLTPQAYNLGLCLTGVYVPVFGACCNDTTAVCADNVELINCLAPARFAANTLCADLNPACGQIPGACCHPDGTCEVVIQPLCTDSWLGPYTVCASCPCIVTCPPSATPEPEACGEDLDGGCNFPPTYPFAPVAPGDVICGTYYANTSTRDTDWYSFTTDQSYEYTWTVRATSPILAFVLDGNAGCGTITVIGQASGAECTDVTVSTACLGPGTYWFWAGSSEFADHPCEQTYIATLTATPCYIPLGACCLFGGTCVPGLSEASCTAQNGQWQGEGVGCDPNPCPITQADFIVDAPGTWTGNTCGAGNDCPLRPSEEHMYQVTIPEDGVWHFDTCGTNWDTYIYVGTTLCGSDIGYNDDGCSASPYSYDSSLAVAIPAGVYFVDVEGYSSTGCGDYILNVFMEAPCILECVGTPENEPDCYENYVDVTNGGCNSTPPVFSPIACGETICGKFGTYLFNGSSYRDTDWYEVTVTGPTIFDFAVNAEAPVLFGMLEQYTPGVPGCDNITGYFLVNASVDKCTPTTITSPSMGAGTYYFFVGPSTFSGVACGSDYIATLTCGVAPTGACCLASGDCGEGTTETECAALAGHWQGAETTCDPNPCEPFFCEAGSSICDEYIGNVIIDSDPPFSNPSDCGAGGYTDYTNLCIPMVIGNTYNIEIDNPVPYSSDQCGIWFDWNHNYTFEPEEAAVVTGTPGGGPYFATIVVPDGAYTAGNIRMRVRVTYTGAVDPCGTTTYGEVEDYCITVSGGVCGDFDGNHQVNVDDYYAFLDAFGTCVGDIKYLPAADFDGDGCITLVDYQAWLACYHDANGVNFVPPHTGRKPATQYHGGNNGSLSR